MKFIKFILIFACMFVIASCTKKTDQKEPPPPTTLPPLRVEKSIITWGINGERDTTVYEYNADGLLTRIIDEDNSRVLTEIQYSGGRISGIRKLIDGRLTSINFHVSNARDTFRVEWQQPSGSGTSNEAQTLVYTDSLLRRYSSQVTFSYKQPGFSNSTDYIYDSDGVLIRVQRDGDPGWYTTYTETNRVKNINFLMGPLWMLFAYDCDYNFGTGRNAVQSLVNSFGELIEIEWVTNSEGYPTSARYKNHPDWDSYEYFYNR